MQRTLRHFLSDIDVSADEQLGILDQADAMKRNRNAYRDALAGRILGMIFQKSSTRTRVAFEAGIIQLGGQAIFLSSKDIQIGRGEPVSDTGGVLSRYLDIIMIRTFSHAVVEDLAKACTIPVINGLDDLVHPCQGLADLMTIRERRGTLAGQQLVYVGDGNNMAHTLMLAGALAGMHVRVISPAHYAPDSDVVAQARQTGQAHGSRIEISTNSQDVDGADAIYTDVWTSMGQEDEVELRRKAFAGYQVNKAMMARAKPDALFMHCMPAHRGEEVSAEVMDGPHAVALQQAENRLHVQKSLMLFLMQQAGKA